jgi:hypothetical protein
MLGGQLLEMIVRRELDTHVIAAAEWALDRHRARATRLLCLGLGDCGELCDHLDNFVKELSDSGRLSGGNGAATSAETLQRLIAVLRATAPAGAHAQIAAIEQRISRASPTGSNGRRWYPELTSRDL